LRPAAKAEAPKAAADMPKSGVIRTESDACDPRHEPVDDTKASAIYGHTPKVATHTIPNWEVVARIRRRSIDPDAEASPERVRRDARKGI